MKESLRVSCLFPFPLLAACLFLRHHPGEPFPRQAGVPPSSLSTGPCLFCFHLREPSLFPNSLYIQVYVRRIFFSGETKEFGRKRAHRQGDDQVHRQSNDPDVQIFDRLRQSGE